MSAAAWRRATQAVFSALLATLPLAGCRTAPPRPDPTPAVQVPPAPVATLPAPPPTPSPTTVMPSVLLLGEADGLLAEGNYDGAARAYEDFLRLFPHDAAASRVR